MYPIDEIEQLGYRQELRRALRSRDMLAYGLILMLPIVPMTEGSVRGLPVG
jgi:hypothetical protein